jgi:excisionase family DNA binding protein
MTKINLLLQTIQDQLVNDIVRELRKDINQLKTEFQPKEPEEYLTRAEVAKMLKVDLSTIHLWSKNGRLKRYGIGKRVYYKRSEIEKELEELIVIK